MYLKNAENDLRLCGENRNESVCAADTPTSTVGGVVYQSYYIKFR